MQMKDNTLFHPDFTVATGIAPVHTFRLAGYTAGQEFHPALSFITYIISACMQNTNRMPKENAFRS